MKMEGKEEEEGEDEANGGERGKGRDTDAGGNRARVRNREEEEARRNGAERGAASLRSPASAFVTASSPARRKSSGGAGAIIPADCLICSDKATGKHYGSISCDGCKGFFRRTIRKKHEYVCRFNRECTVDKNQRNSCRRCRFDKCLAIGMRPEAVQLERDRIAATSGRRMKKSGGGNGTEDEEDEEGRKRRKKELRVMDEGEEEGGRGEGGGGRTEGASTGASPSLAAPSFCVAPEHTLQRLMDAERTLSRGAARGASGKGKGRGGGAAGCKPATTGDVTDSMHHQLILLVEWAKQLEQFRRLPLRSQIALLRHFSGQHLVLCAAFRSLVRSADIDAVWLANDRYVPRDAPKIPDVNRVVARILDHLTGPMRRLFLEEREFVALKAVAFFDPMAKDVDHSSIGEVEDARRCILSAFEYHVQRVSEHRQKMPLRLADLLLLLPPLMAIARDLVEEAQLAKLFGLANVDELMAELLLPEDAETRSYSRLKTSVTSSIVQSNITSPTPPSNAARHPAALFGATAPPATPWLLPAPVPLYSPGPPLWLAAGPPQCMNGGGRDNNNDEQGGRGAKRAVEEPETPTRQKDEEESRV